MIVTFRPRPWKLIALLSSLLPCALAYAQNDTFNPEYHFTSVELGVQAENLSRDVSITTVNRAYADAEVTNCVGTRDIDPKNMNTACKPAQGPKLGLAKFQDFSLPMFWTFKTKSARVRSEFGAPAKDVAEVTIPDPNAVNAFTIHSKVGMFYYGAPQAKKGQAFLTLGFKYSYPKAAPLEQRTVNLEYQDPTMQDKWTQCIGYITKNNTGGIRVLDCKVDCKMAKYGPQGDQFKLRLKWSDDKGKAADVEQLYPAPADTCAKEVPQLTFVEPTAATQEVGSCSVKTLGGLLDGVPLASFPESVSIALSASSATGTFYADANCTTPVSAVAFAQGTASTSFFYRDSAAGSPQLTASPLSNTNVGGVSSVFDVVGLAVVQFDPALSATHMASNGCVAVPVRLLDESLVPFSPSQNTLVQLSTSSPSGAFYANSSCSGSPVSSATVPAGSSQVNMYYHDTASSSVVALLQASVAQSGVEGSSLSVGVDAVQSIRLIGAPYSGAVGACIPMSVGAADGVQSPAVSSVPLSVNLDTNSPTGAFYSDSGCLEAIGIVGIPAMSLQGDFYYRDGSPGSFAIGAAEDSTASSSSGTITIGASSPTPTPVPMPTPVSDMTGM